MERLWSRAVATGATGGKCGNVENGSDSRKPVAVGCHQLPQKCHGKEGVDGSSPPQGSAKAAQNRDSSCRGNLHEFPYAAGHYDDRIPLVSSASKEASGFTRSL